MFFKIQKNQWRFFILVQFSLQISSISDNKNMDVSESESDDEIIGFKRPSASVLSSSQEHNQKTPKRRRFSHTQNPKSKPSTGTATSSGKRKRTRKVKSGAVDEAERIRLSLNSEFPSFVKCMVKSCVEGSACPVPLSISRSHLPKEETMITLEDENKKKFQVKYLRKWSELSGGWRDFVAAHKLKESDVLLFHLVEPNKFKVYIIKARSEDVVISRILNLDEEKKGYVKGYSKKVKSGAMDEAERIRLSLKSEFPSFVKYMSKSFVEGSACPLPLSISGSHLPKEETMITLEDENDKKFQVKYIPNGSCLSGGWRNFAVVQKLRVSDVLLFHLVESNKFKVYIIRPHSEVAVVPRIMDVDDEEGGSKSSDDPTDPSEDLPTFEEFRRRIGEESTLDEDTLEKYYKLCSCKNVILHNETFSDRNSKLKAGVISEVVNIADALKTCSIVTPSEKLEEWKNSLKSFELLGMKVEFLVNRVSQLMKLRDEYEGTRFEDELKKLEAQRVAMKEAYIRHCNNIGKMMSKAAEHKVKFQKFIDSPL